MATDWELEFGSDRPSALSDLVSNVVDGRMARAMSAGQQAAAAWYRANGDRERAHTVGVFLKKPRRAGAAPILGVYVDSHAMATDFGVNKDIYLARLANVGFAVSGIEFMVSRQPRREQDRDGGAESPKAAGPEEPTREEEQEAARLVADLPESLRDRAARAVALSLHRKQASP